jgi:uncharacterized membrane protein
MERRLRIESKLGQFVASMLALQVSLYFTIFFNIPVARQAIGFLYLTFVPGFIMLKLLKQDRLSIIETILFSVGLSIAFLMFVGLVMNVVGPLIGFGQPLEPTPLILVISCLVLLEALLYCVKSGLGNELSNEANLRIPIRVLLLAILPILSIIGAFWANATGNTSILLLTLVATLVEFGIAVFSKRLLPTKLLTIVVFTVAVALLFQLSLVSNHLNGFSDIQIEYYVFSQTQKIGYWNSTVGYTEAVYGTYNNMLSVTVLPTVYSNVLNMDATWILKIVFPMIFAFVPVALYIMWREKLGATIALFSAFLLMSQVTFYTEMLTLARQMTAELFFVLLFIVLFSKKFSHVNTVVLFLVFSFSLIVSHYSMALIFIFLLSTTWLSTYYTKKTRKNLTLYMVILFFAIMFAWYVYTSASISFETMLSFANTIYLSLGNFFNPASRGEGVMRGLGIEQAGSSLQLVSRMVAYATELFIIIGFLILLVQRDKRKIDFEYFSLCSANIVILALCILLPNFALSLQITRFYHILLFFLAPLMSIGCITCIEFTAKTKKRIYSAVFIAMLIMLYFLFQSNFVYEITGSKSWSVTLSGYRLGSRLYTEFAYSTDAKVSGAGWLSQHGNFGNAAMYTDSSNMPTIWRFIYRGEVIELANTTFAEANEFVYLGELNTVYEMVLGTRDVVWNTSDIVVLQSLSGTYTNGYCQIFENTGGP